MSKRLVHPAALKAIRELRAATDPAFKGGRFGPAIGISHGHLCNVEAERRPLTDDAIERAAALLQVPIAAITIPNTLEAVA
jgi:hypothetical protein